MPSKVTLNAFRHDKYLTSIYCEGVIVLGINHMKGLRKYEENPFSQHSNLYVQLYTGYILSSKIVHLNSTTPFFQLSASDNLAA